ncbi:hypothetical protein B0J12DRAFT_752378 [Macrophomina phaseolina]|uniref:DUF7907 domain-containing protein n=1 Tax=Macrophomina phaseolina TaxID=35725 RepID=A0ABQ8GBB1_9PEZI|nr:hypothetical protein B0J12DRAFT_752378 [Macrophomina phaseolina]
MVAINTRGIAGAATTISQYTTHTVLPNHPCETGISFHTGVPRPDLLNVIGHKTIIPTPAIALHKECVTHTPTATVTAYATPGGTCDVNNGRQVKKVLKGGHDGYGNPIHTIIKDLFPFHIGGLVTNVATRYEGQKTQVVCVTTTPPGEGGYQATPTKEQPIVTSAYSEKLPQPPDSKTTEKPSDSGYSQPAQSKPNPEPETTESPGGGNSQPAPEPTPQPETTKAPGIGYSQPSQPNPPPQTTGGGHSDPPPPKPEPEASKGPGGEESHPAPPKISETPYLIPEPSTSTFTAYNSDVVEQVISYFSQYGQGGPVGSKTYYHTISEHKPAPTPAEPTHPAPEPSSKEYHPAPEPPASTEASHSSDESPKHTTTERTTIVYQVPTSSTPKPSSEDHNPVPEPQTSPKESSSSQEPLASTKASHGGRETSQHTTTEHTTTVHHLPTHKSHLPGKETLHTSKPTTEQETGYGKPTGSEKPEHSAPKPHPTHTTPEHGTHPEHKEPTAPHTPDHGPTAPHPTDGKSTHPVTTEPTAHPPGPTHGGHNPTSKESTHCVSCEAEKSKTEAAGPSSYGQPPSPSPTGGPYAQPPASKDLCPGHNGERFKDNLTGKTFIIECGIDRYGGDFGGAHWPGAFDSCIAICASTPKCVDITWKNGACYLKNTLEDKVYDKDAWSARLADESKETKSGYDQPSPPTTYSEPGTTSSKPQPPHTWKPGPSPSHETTEPHTKTTFVVSAKPTKQPEQSQPSDGSTGSNQPTTTAPSESSGGSTTKPKPSEPSAGYTTPAGPSTEPPGTPSTKASSPPSSSGGGGDSGYTAPPPPPPQKTGEIFDPHNPGGDKCDGKLNHGGKLFRLRTHVVSGAGSPEFENLYLTYARDTAGKFFLDGSTTSVALWHGKCQFSGLTMFGERDGDPYSPAFLSNSVGTHRMRAAWGSVFWDNDRFDGWVVCRRKGGEERYELKWHNAESNQGVDTSKCAKVELLTENL